MARVAPLMSPGGPLYLAGNISFTITLYTFMEWIHLLNPVIHPWKKWWIGENVDDGIYDTNLMISHMLGQLEDPRYPLSLDEDENLFMEVGEPDLSEEQILNLIASETGGTPDSVQGLLDHTTLTAQFKNMGNQMQTWNLFLTMEHSQSMSLWMEKLNNFFQPYSGYKEILSQLYLASKENGIHDIFFLDTFDKTDEDLKKKYCDDENKSLIKQKSLTFWETFCSDEKSLALENEDIPAFKVETVSLLSSYVDKALEAMENAVGQEPVFFLKM